MRFKTNRDGEIAQLVKSLMGKHEGLSSLPSTHVLKNNLGVVSCAHNPKAGKGEAGRFLGLAGHTAWPPW